jgi:hypothetical protein
MQIQGKWLFTVQVGRRKHNQGDCMAAQMQRLTVDSVSAMEQAITSYITQGFTVVNKTATSVTLVKEKAIQRLVGRDRVPGVHSASTDLPDRLRVAVGSSCRDRRC